MTTTYKGKGISGVFSESASLALNIFSARDSYCNYVKAMESKSNSAPLYTNDFISRVSAEGSEFALLTLIETKKSLVSYVEGQLQGNSIKIADYLKQINQGLAYYSYQEDQDIRLQAMGLYQLFHDYPSYNREYDASSRNFYSERHMIGRDHPDFSALINRTLCVAEKMRDIDPSVSLKLSLRVMEVCLDCEDFHKSPAQGFVKEYAGATKLFEDLSNDIAPFDLLEILRDFGVEKRVYVPEYESKLKWLSSMQELSKEIPVRQFDLGLNLVE